MSSEEEDDELVEMEKIRDQILSQPCGERMQVSAWEDDTAGIEEQRNAEEPDEKAILTASEKGNLHEVVRLIGKNPELLECKDKDGYTPLHRACYDNQIEVVKYLLQQGAKIDSKTQDEWQPLHSACCWNHVKCAALLIEQGADINAKSKGDQTPLHLVSASSYSSPGLQLLLLHPDIDPSIVNSSGDTAEMIARRTGQYWPLFELVEPYLNDIYGKTIK